MFEKNAPVCIFFLPLLEKWATSSLSPPNGGYPRVADRGITWKTIMTMKPRFMPKYRSGCPWKPSGVRGVPLAAALSFSSKSPFAYDDWERRHVRPFQIVALPGYTPPPMSSNLRRDSDHMWYDRPVKKPTIVWDGYCPIALWEIVYGGFGQSPTNPRMRVRSAVHACWIDDPRDSDLLMNRPKEEGNTADPILDPYGYALARRKYRRAMIGWAHACSRQDKGGYGAEAAWRKTATMYAAVLTPDSEWHVDDAQRQTLAEAKWNRDHITPIVEGSDYKSPIRFMDQEMDRMAHQAYVREAAAQKAAAERRRQMALDAPVEQDVRGSWWSRILGV